MKSALRLSAALGLTLLAACEPNLGGGADVNTAGAASGTVTALSAEPQAATELARDFETIAFSQTGAGTLRRMQSPLTITATMPEENMRSTSSLLESVVTKLESGAGVRIMQASRFDADGAPVFGPDQRGFWVLFSDKAEIEAMLDESGGLRASIRAAGCGAMAISGPGEIPFGAIIFVEASRPASAQSYCVHREMVAGMGLAGFLPRRDSIFSDNVQATTFSARDLALVRMLYDPRLRPGMTAAQARPLLPAIAADALSR